MYQLICRTVYTGENGPGGLLETLRLRVWRQRWNTDNQDRTGKEMQIRQVDDTLIAYFEFENEEQAVIFKLTYL